MEQYYERDTWYHLIPLIFVAAVVPLIVYLKVIPLSGPLYEAWNGQKENMDFFSYYKAVWLIAFSVFSVMMIIVKYVQDDFKLPQRSFYFIPICVYIVAVVLSSLISKYKEVALKGFIDRYEGMYVLIAYMIILVSIIYLCEKEKHIKILLGAVIASAVIIGFIGLFQYIGYDLWKTNFGKDLMLPQKYEPLASKLNFSFGKYQIYATLYNIDYVGSYTAMLLPLSLTICILTRNKPFKFFMAVFTLLMLITWFGANSRAGWLGGICAILIFLVMIRKYIKKHWKYFVVFLLFIIVMTVGLDKISNGYISKRVGSIGNELTSSKSSSDKQENIPLKSVKVNGNTAIIQMETDTLKVLARSGQVIFEDDKGKNIPVTFDKSKGKIILTDNRYKDYDIALGKMENITSLIVKRKLQQSPLVRPNITMQLFFKLENDKIALINSRGKVLSTDTVEKFGFQGKEKLGSARGYIWSRTLPLLKHTILLGYGPDTYAFYFPQQDLVGKMYAYNGDMWMIVDKPHNFYLQTAVNTGVISLIALLAIFGVYIKDSLKLYFRNQFMDFNSIVGLGLFVGVCGYLVSAIFNDSLVSVAPVFWILLGMGISTNKMVASATKKSF